MGATKTMVYLIVALIIVVLMVSTVGGFYASVLFSGPELKASSTIRDSLNAACIEQPGFVTTFNVFLPDSMESLSHKSYFYIAIDNYKLLLRTKEEAKDMTTAFMDFVTGRPGDITIKEYDLKSCKDDNVLVCGKLDTDVETCSPPGKFQFESNEGKESLTFTLNRTKDSNGDKVILSYERGESPKTE